MCQLLDVGVDSKKETDRGYGMSSQESFARYDPHTHSLKMSQDSLLPDLIESSVILPQCGSMRNGYLFRRQMWGLSIAENGCSFWRTPTTGMLNADRAKDPLYAQRKINKGQTITLADHVRLWSTPQAFDATCGDLWGKEYNGRTRHARKLIQAALLWPTPTKADAEGGRTSKGKDRPNEGGLAMMAKLWPTPSARDWKSGQSSEETANRNARPLNEVVLYPTPTSAPESLLQITGEKTPQMSLNPDWVDWLMGYPIKWTDCEPWATL